MLNVMIVYIDYDTLPLKTFSSVEYSQKYCVIYNYWESQKEYSEGPHITLVLHATSGYLSHLKEQLTTWTGGISVSVFIPSPHNQSESVVEVLKNQLYLRSIFSALSSPEGTELRNSGQISLHLFFQNRYFRTCPEFVIPENMYSILGASLSDIKDFGDIVEVYPINVARNIARKEVKTTLFVSGDIEQFYVRNFEARMYELAKRILIEGKKKTVLVYRRFELQHSAPIPRNKAELKQLIAEKKAVEFHARYYLVGHHIRNLHRWLETPEHEQETRVVDEIFYRNEEWEPQFVGDERVPFHDERFPYRYRTNVQLGLHLCFKNFSFSVVSDLFSMHRGILEEQPLKISFIKALVEKMKPYVIRKIFRKDLAATYPEMAKVCPLIAALYGIGMYPNVNRTPGLSGLNHCLKDQFSEFAEIMPNVVKLVEFEDLSDKQFTRTTFGRRMYENPEVIHDVPDKYLVINHGYLHGIRYFSHVMDEIRQLFDFHPKLKAEVEEYGTQLFIFDKLSHKMCVHIRRNDFLKHRLLETRTEFLIPAMKTVKDFLSEKYPGKQISLIFFTDDEKYVDSLEFPKDDYLNIYRPILPSRGAVMYFGIRYCDSLLQSASGSSFASWIGFLMPEGKDFFYHRRVFKNIKEDMGKDYVDYERHPKHWNILELDESQKTVFIDNRWNFERYNKPNL